ncbi:MAG: DUF2914 domain-containing protein [Bacteroidota bacterium]
MMKTQLFSFFCLLCLITATATAQDIKVTQLDFATAIEDRQPVEADTAFSADVEKVFCFTKVEGVTDTTQITHVWHYKGEEVARIDLDVTSDPWRTWSSKSILEKWTGPWRVMVLDPEENVLASETFVITEED